MVANKQTAYAQDGVDVEEGDSFSKFAGALCRQTYKNSPFVTVRDFSRAHFRGPRGFQLNHAYLPQGCWLDITPDGDGTKVVVVDAAGDYDHAANGFVAMTFGDVTRWGGLPLISVNNLDTETLGKTDQPVNNAFRRMMLSLKRLADEQQFVMFKGETAELPGCVTSPNPYALAKYLWSGVAFGVYNPKTIITGDKIRPDMIVMALRELGFRNNGISSVRKALTLKFGTDWRLTVQARRALAEAAVPAVLYDQFLAHVNGWYAPNFKPVIPMYLIVHVTGGALKSKFAEDILFPRGLSAELDNLWDPPKIMRQCAKWRGMDDEQCYETWNGGQGSLVVIDAHNENEFVELASAFGIEAKRAGKITQEEKPQVILHSKFSGKIIPWCAGAV